MPCRASKGSDLTPYKPIFDTYRGTVLLIYAQPQASITECVGRHGNVLKIRVAAPPRDGAANDELRRFLADRFHLPLADVQVLSGQRARHKRVRLKGVSMERARDVLTPVSPVRQT
jgi:uncharacterized protein (TIGR00251 family)